MANSVARLEGRSFACELDINRLEHGLHGVCIDEVAFNDLRLLCISFDRRRAESRRFLGSAKEAVVRGSDLLISYEAATEEDVSLRLRWTALSAEDLPDGSPGVQLSICAQTQGWDSVPALLVDSVVNTSARWKPVAAVVESLNLPGPSASLEQLFSPELAFLSRRAKGNRAVALMVYPTETVNVVNATAGDASQLQVHLFGPRLERGVILVGLLRFYVLPNSVDDAGICHLYEQFIRSPLPLTV
jgi:hypothetical protein